MKATRYKVTDHVIEERVGNEVIILSLEQERFYTLNGTGLVLWEVMKGGGDSLSMVKRLVAEFKREESDAREDVDIFLTNLLKTNLIEEVQTFDRD